MGRAQLSAPSVGHRPSEGPGDAAAGAKLRGQSTWTCCKGCRASPGASGLSSACCSAGIVVSPSAASPSEGTSSDSCLTSAGDGLAGLSGHLVAQGLLSACSPLRLASPLLGTQSATPVLQAQGALGGAALLPVSFQEGRRASDTSLTQGDFPFRAHFCLPWETRVHPGGHHFVLNGRWQTPLLAGPGGAAVLPGQAEAAARLLDTLASRMSSHGL